MTYWFLCKCVFQSLFHHVVCVCVYSSMYHLHQPPHQASSCLSVCPYSCVHVCVFVPTHSKARWVNVLPAISPESQAHVHGDPDQATPTVPLSVPPELNSSVGLGSADGQGVGICGYTLYTQRAKTTKNKVITWNQTQKKPTIPLLTPLSTTAAPYHFIPLPTSSANSGSRKLGCGGRGGGWLWITSDFHAAEFIITNLQLALTLLWTTIFH